MPDDGDVPEHEEEETDDMMDPNTHAPEASPEPVTSPARGSSTITPGKTYMGIPFEQIEELAQRYQQVPVRIQRRNAKGQLGTIEGHLNVETISLLQIEIWLKPKHGGGSFHVEVRDPVMPAQRIFSFDFVLEGMPVLAGPVSTAAASQAPSTSPFAPPYTGSNPSAPLPLAIPVGMPNRAWVEGLGPAERTAVIQQWMSQHGPPVATHASDQIALEVEARTRAELAKTRETADRRQRELELELEKMRIETAKAKEEAKEAAHQAELRALSAKIDAMTTKEPPKGMADTIAALAPLVPLGIAWLQSNAQQQQAQLTHQQAGFQAMMAAAQPKQQPDSMKEILTTLGPVFLPLLTKSMDRDSPESQAKLFSALTESQLQTVSMMAQLVQETAPPAPSPIGAAIQQGLEGIKNVALAYITSQGGLPGQLPGARPAGVLRAAAPVGGGYSTLDENEAPQQPVQGEVVEKNDVAAAEAQSAQKAPKPPPPEVEALFSMLPADFQSAEWRLILTKMHSDPPLAAEGMANLLCGHLEHLMNFGMLPSMLAGIRTQPRETLESVLEKLPIAMSQPAYAAKVLDITLGMLMEDRYVPQAEAPAQERSAGDGEEDDSGEAAAEE